MIVFHTLKRALRQGACAMTRYQADLLPRLLCALIQTRSVNLKQVAAVLGGRRPWPATIAACSGLSAVVGRRRWALN